MSQFIGDVYDQTFGYSSYAQKVKQRIPIGLNLLGAAFRASEASVALSDALEGKTLQFPLIPNPGTQLYSFPGFLGSFSFRSLFAQTEEGGAGTSGSVLAPDQIRSGAVRVKVVAA